MHVQYRVEYSCTFLACVVSFWVVIDLVDRMLNITNPNLYNYFLIKYNWLFFVVWKFFIPEHISICNCVFCDHNHNHNHRILIMCAKPTDCSRCLSLRGVLLSLVNHISCQFITKLFVQYYIVYILTRCVKMGQF